MQRLQEHWFGPVAAIRPYLFQKCMTLMVAFDLLVLMVERGARYGTDRIAFSVAHFPILDTVHRAVLGPDRIPGPFFYVCVLTLTSFLSFCLFFGGHRRWLMALVCLLFTYAWSMSRLDSYLHHYMLSLIMFCMIFFRTVDARSLRTWLSGDDTKAADALDQAAAVASGAGSQNSASWIGGTLLGLALVYRLALSQFIGLDVTQRWTAMYLFFVVLVGLVMWGSRSVREGTGPLTSAWSFKLLLTTVGVIYVFTAVAKMDSEWCGGHTLKAVGMTETVLQPLVRMSESIGVSADRFWSLLATLVIPLELILAGIYFWSGGQDTPKRKWLPRVSLCGWLLAVGLHLNNEMMSLVIQWFGYYMLLLATVLLLPARFLLVAGAVFVEPECWLRERFEKFCSHRKDSLLAVLATTLLGIFVVAAFAFFSQIPGMMIAAGVVAIGIMVFVALCIIMAWNRSSLLVGTVSMFAALAMTLAIAQSSMQFDYHALRGLTLMGVGDVGQAIQHLEASRAYRASSKSSSSEAQTNLAICYLKLYPQLTNDEDKLSLAKGIERTFREAIEEDPLQFPAYYSFGNFLVLRERFGEAEQMFQRAIRIKPNYSDAYFNLGSLYEQAGRLQNAIGCFETAAKIEPYAQDIQQRLANVRAKLQASSQN